MESKKKSKKSRRKRDRIEEMEREEEEVVCSGSEEEATVATTGRAVSSLDEMRIDDEVTAEGLDEMEGDDFQRESSPDSGERRPRFRNFGEAVQFRKLTSDSILVSLSTQQVLYFMGKCAVKVVRGTVDIYGCILTAADPKRFLFSPKGHSSLLCVTGVAAKSSATDGVVDDEFSQFLDEELLEDLPGAVFVMQAFDNDWSLGLRNLTSRGDSLVGPCPMGIGPTSVLPGMKDFMIKLGFQFVPESMWSKYRLMKSSWEWDRIFEKLNEESHPSRICVFGGKGVGKSTFNRWLTNRLLSCSNYRDGIVFVDLDPGQTEFTPPGVISVSLCKEPILGPNFSHIQQPDKCVFLGGVSVADFPIRYLHAAVQLFEFISGAELMQNRPIIINTMGFSQGLGVNLAVSVIKIFRPSAVVQLAINNDRRSFPFDLRFDKIQHFNNGFVESKLSSQYRQTTPFILHKIDSLCSDDNANANPWGRRGGNPKELRDDMLLSYFAPLIPATTDFSFKSVVPLNVFVRDVSVGSMDSSLNFYSLIKAMLGNIVALCEIPDLETSTSAPNLRPRPGLSQSLDASPRTVNKELLHSNNFYGYGVLRAYDEAAKVFHIITPVESALLNEHVNVIIIAGMIGLPSEIYTAGVKSNSEIPYVVNSKGGKSLHSAGKKYYAPKRVTHPVLRTSLL